jgi:hypothetical protein
MQRCALERGFLVSFSLKADELQYGKLICVLSRKLTISFSTLLDFLSHPNY